MKSADPPIAAGAGQSAPTPPDGDPYRTLDELMVVVEALCRQWPPRTGITTGTRMLL